MSKLETYVKCFKESFLVEESELEDLKYQDIEEWDSVGHIRLILLVEKKFKIKIDQSEYPNLLSLKSLIKYIEKKIG